ncbi:MAG: L,D-transpeptidase [Verrucomicrobiaceae bacterium]
MPLHRLFSLTLLLIAGLFLTSCGPTPPPDQAASVANPKKAGFVNPYPPGTYDHFKAEKYPGTTRTWKNDSLLATANPGNTSVRINISTQRGFLLVNDEVAIDYRISTGRRGKYDTPTGNFRITEKVKDKRSNLYGTIYNAAGKVAKSNADARKDEIPEGGKFVGAPMLYWMRLTGDGIGMHKGNVNSRYASHGCIRSHYSAVPIVFSKTKVGTPVVVEP